MIPILLAGLAGYVMSNPRRRKHGRRRNPETFKWKLSAAILPELYFYEVENFESAQEALHPKLYAALEAVGSKGPKTITLDRAGSKELHSALDDMADVKGDGGYGSERALTRATEKLRDKVAATLNGAASSAKPEDAYVEESRNKPGKFMLVVGSRSVRGPDGQTIYYGSREEATKHLPKTNPRGKKRSNPGGEPKKVFFNDSSKIPPELLRQLQTVKPDYESDDQTSWTLVWDGWEWKATGCSTIATRDKPNLCDLTLEPIWPVSTKKSRGKR